MYDTELADFLNIMPRHDATISQELFDVLENEKIVANGYTFKFCGMSTEDDDVVVIQRTNLEFDLNVRHGHYSKLLNDGAIISQYSSDNSPYVGVSWLPWYYAIKQHLNPIYLTRCNEGL
jgi:hypothetical protein